MTNNGRFSYPEEIRSEFIETGDLIFKDGSHVTAEEIWNFMTEEAPRRFPYNFDTRPYWYFMTRISEDVELFSGIKRNYLFLSLRDYLLKAHAKGIPIVLVQGGQTMEPYHAAGAIPLRPGFVMYWAQNMKEGLNVNDLDMEGQFLLDAGRKWISVDACDQINAHAAVQEETVPIDFVAPYLCTRCSDMAYLVEAHRHGKRQVPTYLLDYPISDQRNKEWAVEYVIKMLKRLTRKLGELSNREVSEEDLKKEIKIENQGRKLLRDYMELWWSASVPPTNSIDHADMPYFGNDFIPDTTVTVNLLKEMYKEIKERVKHSIKGKGLADDPIRLYICGSCVEPNPVLVDRAGGVLVGKDDQWSQVSTNVDESGDPYRNLAKALLSFPYEQSTEERAIWSAEQVKKSRADGVIFMYNWGCNYQSAVARMIADIIKNETCVPSIVIEVGELGRVKSLEQSHNRVEAFIEMLK